MATIEELKQRKKELKMTMDTLSEISTIPKRTLEDVFRGVTKNPRIDTMQAIEKALGLDKTQEERELKELYAGATEEKKQLFDLIMSLSDEQVDKLTEFADFLISKREK